MQLRDYQERGINEIRAQFVQGRRRACYVAPCGSGKTMVMAYMASRAVQRGRRALFLVHRRELIEQAAETFRRMNLSFDVIAPGYATTGEKIQIGSVQTVARRIGALPEPGLIILDECHHATAATWLSILRFFSAAKVVGLTATPARLSGEGLGSVFDALVMSPGAKELIRRGYLAPYRYYAPPLVVDLSGVRTVRGEYEPGELSFRMDRPQIIGDAIAHYCRLAAGTQAICYCAGRAHSMHTAELFKLSGIAARHVDAKTPASERTAAMAAFRAKELQVLCNCDLFGEGVDVPTMETVILLRPTKSLTLYIQQSMRGMRPDPQRPDKQAIILDHVGNVLRHGLPDTERHWSLEGRKKTARQTATAQVAIQVCERCFSAHDPAPACPYCGYVYAVKERILPQKAGVLAEYSETEKKERRTEVGRARSLAELEHIAAARGYKAGWVYVQAKLRGWR